MTTHIRELEERLRLAMLHSDVPELDALLDDDLLFVGPEGGVYTKADDLELYRSGVQKVSQADWQDIQMRFYGSTYITVVAAQLAGTFKGAPFSGLFRYVRTWVQRERGWRVVAGSVSATSGQGHEHAP